MKNEGVTSKTKTIVVGAGLTGAAIAMVKPFVSLYDKAHKPGGRVSTKTSRLTGERFDIGATMFRDHLEVDWMGKISSYNVFKIWKTNGIKLETKPIYDSENFYPLLGMESIVESMLNGNPTNQSMTLKSISRSGDGIWNLSFHSHLENQTKVFMADHVILTLPIPQMVDILNRSEKNSDLDRWTKFLEPYNDYRKTLVSFFSWKNWSPNLSAHGFNNSDGIPVSTILNRGDDWEYQSWEHIKYPNSNSNGKSSSLLVQFSSLFSETHFETWMDSDKQPNAFYKELLIEGLKEKWLAPPPDEIWNHRWKFAQSQMPLLGREGALKLDSDEFSEWRELCKSTGITMLGDWFFGSKLERIVGGVYFLNHNGLL
ncbi:NAD(P)-binding Rossmann-like domain protein [Leptospira yanagawae serovar Saopaulo str. Sao Paulo = ATCC 700523]|uniref:NAD(P)-binding Rossmann-like domain protein n=1 Tax=Leptospira yanagawae serovar Saopaulo str. Sao Paulo = ATCC 700523 TaxID=1249483 RepID=A0A5E8HBI6_9LEPT|nr:FAD-dependent oxidoreductase [Leptospira yanagawae]EOQ87940.1 NAD(P)-binding Rossmann-like domain protein [Leptospira yanagawae serovar Saopaulo str. Sao Paulo = ATCC 700523]